MDTKLLLAPLALAAGISVSAEAAQAPKILRVISQSVSHDLEHANLSAVRSRDLDIVHIIGGAGTMDVTNQDTLRSIHVIGGAG